MARTPAGTPPPALSGWRKYLEMRLANTADASGTLRIEPPMIDGLSYPLSLVFALQQLRLRPPQPGPLQLLLVGASSKAEERLMRETTYWHELLHYFPGANLELGRLIQVVCPQNTAQEIEAFVPAIVELNSRHDQEKGSSVSHTVVHEMAWL